MRLLRKLGWLFGLIGGALLGMLFAPRKGKELRAKIKAQRREGKLGIAPLQDDIKQIVSDVADVARDFYESPAITKIVQQSKKTFEEVKEQVKDATSDLSQAFKSEEKTVTDDVQFEKHQMHKRGGKKKE